MEDAAPAANTPAFRSRFENRGTLGGLLAMMGPAFVAAIAYVDPGNFATNFSAGGEYRYLLVWVIVLANLMAMLVQYLSSKLGLITGESLPRLCGALFSRRVNVGLWVQAELIVMATDLAEFTGAALGLHLLLPGVPLFTAGLITAVVAFGILWFEQRGYRRFELLIMALLMILAGGFVFDWIKVGHQVGGALARGFVPHLAGGNSLTLAVGIVGATVMPHVVYLHSNLHRSRIRSEEEHYTRRLLRFNQIDCVVALGLAGVVNIAMLCIAAALVEGHGVISSPDLGAIHATMNQYVDGGAALAFAIALIASGLSSSTVGTYAGQVVMEGFVGWKSSVILRRGLTMLPSLAVLAFVSNTTTALVWSQIALSFGIPFALVPLVLVTARSDVMGIWVNRRSVTFVTGLVTTAIVVMNIWLLGSAL